MKLRNIGLIVIIGLIGSSSLAAQDSTQLALRIDGSLFFVNDEYSGSQLDGYTLPGFMLRPHVDWRLDRHVGLQAGVNWLYYWGNTGFPQGVLDEVMPRAGDSLQALHLVPWLQARIGLTPWLNLVLGSLETGHHHDLPLPLYNPERTFATDPEAGAQLLLDSRYLALDAWVDWREFIWYNSRHQERFNCGISVTPRYKTNRFRLALPLHAIVQHRGGEGLADTTIGHHSYYNCAVGLDAAYTPGDFDMGFTAYLLTYSRTGAPEEELVYDSWGCLVAPPPSFKRGYGVWTTLTATWRTTRLNVDYWSGDKFVPLLGSYLFSNLSSNISDMTHRRLQLVMLRAQHTWKFSGCDLQCDAAYIHTFAHAADRLNYWPCSLEAEDMFSFGIVLLLHPSIALIR